ncbi:MAG: nitroreductase family protein [Dehalococcoidales bacterium]|nr:nitroreductase family protein [Dehalococcoidales bacterium]
MELFEAIKSRRSIRRYTSDPVDDKKVEAILEAGRWAPSWANTQCWRFMVVRDPEIKARVAETLSKIKLPDKVVDNPGANAIKTVPVLIVVCAEMGKSGGKPGSGGGGSEYITDKGDWFMFDTALAVQNMVLAAHALGLGTVIIGAFDAVQAEKVLGVPEGYRVVTLFPVGVPDQEGKAPPRKELSEITVRDRWNK